MFFFFISISEQFSYQIIELYYRGLLRVCELIDVEIDMTIALENFIQFFKFLFLLVLVS